MTLWSDKTAAKATKGRASSDWQASRVEIDSRRIRAGDLFVALKGERMDGHQFVGKALAAGAVAAVVSQPEKGNTLLVKDTQSALEALGQEARARSKAAVIGVTGSVGKTGAKDMITLALAAHGKTHATSGNFNNHIGVPLSLANLSSQAQFAIFEMGMNHAGEISKLTKMVQPDIAIITNIEAVHMEFFASIEAIADAKAEIFEGMTKGVAILNADNPYSGRLTQAATKKGLSVIHCGEAQEADCRLTSYRTTPQGCEVAASIFGKEVRFTLGAVGRHWAITALFALAVAHALKLDIGKTAQALARFQEPEGRGRISRLASGVLLIDDSYNASPASMRAAFAKTSEVWESAGRTGRKLAALGDMLELGPNAHALHQKLADDLQRLGFDTVFTAGEAMRYLHEALPSAVRGSHVATAEALIPLLGSALKKNDILLIKGSHGSHMYDVAKALLQAEQTHAV